MADEPANERRQQPRIPLDARATIARAEQKIAASTKDISERGLFFFSEARIEVGSDIDILLMVPEDIGLPINGMVCCHGRIVRMAPAGEQYGMGMEIDGVEPASLL
ncbi:MAG: PilZ domain-containing protein [Terriglobales bacterium]